MVRNDVALLFDAHLSPRLVADLRTTFPGSAHVATVGLLEAADDEIREFARERGYVVVTKDRGFRDVAAVRGGPPKVIWLRVGNATTETIAGLLESVADQVGSFVDDNVARVLVLRPL